MERLGLREVSGVEPLLGEGAEHGAPGVPRDLRIEHPASPVLAGALRGRRLLGLRPLRT